MNSKRRETTSQNILSSESRNLDRIENNLWLGNLIAATDTETLYERKINFILTLNSFPLPRKISDLHYIHIKYIEVFDTPRDDLLSHFEETYNFIEHAVKNGVILVHCYSGVSRSATIVVSYLMKKKNMTVKAALECVKSKRKCVEPNLGFLEQLNLYEIMHYTLDKNNNQYKMLRLYIIADHIKKASAIPESFADVIKADPFLVTENVDCTLYKCKKCRRIVALNSHLIPHAPKEKYSWKNSWWDKSSKNTEFCQQIYFIEPLAWMENIVVSLEGKLLCPNTICKNKLGSYSWIAGCQCPCGTEIYPGFYLTPSKVDKENKMNFTKGKS